MQFEIDKINPIWNWQNDPKLDIKYNHKNFIET